MPRTPSRRLYPLSTLLRVPPSLLGCWLLLLQASLAPLTAGGENRPSRKLSNYVIKAQAWPWRTGNTSHALNLNGNRLFARLCYVYSFDVFLRLRVQVLLIS